MLRSDVEIWGGGGAESIHFEIWGGRGPPGPPGSSAYVVDHLPKEINRPSCVSVKVNTHPKGTPLVQGGWKYQWG